MTPDALNAWVAIIGLPLVFGAGCMQGASQVADVHASAPAKAATIRPLSARLGCQPWEPGLSRSVTIIATEDEAGMLVGMQCVRAKERGRMKVM